MGKSKSKKNPKQVVIDTPKSDVDSEDSEEVDGDDADENDENDEITEETLTALGRAMASLPLHPPALAKLLVLAAQAGGGATADAGVPAGGAPSSLLES